MNYKNRILNDLSQLGNLISEAVNSDDYNSVFNRAEIENPWFTREFILQNLNYWGNKLNKNELIAWTDRYKISEESDKTVGIVMAGNIPIVGMHDLIAVLLSGHKAIIKASSKDRVLTEFICNLLYRINPDYKNRIKISEERFINPDAVIATGSDNTARYFDYYFRNTPHIIRKNRNSVAVLDGNESDDDLKKLADDIFMYFGLGCRNVSAVFIPESMDEKRLLDNFEKYRYFTQHNKYMNNYMYHKAIYLMDRRKHLDNDFLLLKESWEISSPLAVLNFGRYNYLKELKNYLSLNKDKIQCIVTNNNDFKDSVRFGNSQNPGLNTYADNIDTLDFLLNLK